MSTPAPHVEPLDDRLRSFARIAPRAGIFTDFDGSLSNIVEHHDDARAVPGAAAALAALAERFAVVAVVSGRDTRALARNLRAPGVRLFGAYGVEERVGTRTVGIPEAEAQRPAIRRATQRLRHAVASSDGVVIEPKGLATAVHFRPASDPVAAERALAREVHDIAAAEGLDVMVGKLVLELRPRVSMDKGRRVRAVIDELALSGGLAAGDDHGDIAMFEALDGLDVAVRVAVSGPEVPRELLRRADIVVDSPAALVGLFRSVASASGPGSDR